MVILHVRFVFTPENTEIYMPVYIWINVEIDNTQVPVITSTHEYQYISMTDGCYAYLPDCRGDVEAFDECASELTITQNPEPNTFITGDGILITLRAYDQANNYAQATFFL